MTTASKFHGWNSENVISDPVEAAVSEIYETYGVKTRVGRKSLHKFGRYANVGTTETDVAYLGIDPIHSATNSITHFSSANAADVGIVLRVEGFTIVGNDLTFVVQNITLNGQTKTALATPVSRVTRIANVAGPLATLGDVYVYEDGAITGGIPNDLGTVGGVMAATDQSTLFAGTSIAKSNYFICTNYWAYLGKKTAASADIRLKVQSVGNNFYRSIAVANISNYAGMHRAFMPYIIIPPNTDIDITAVGSTTGVDVFAGFDGFFADIIS